MTATQWDGFLPGAKCKRCGDRLQGQGEGRPAESYAGTYTGLCYPCNDRPAEIVGHYSDGADLWSFPPALPSWRRDRETYYGFAGCLTCKGSGAVWQTIGSFGNSHRSQCRTCSNLRYGAWHAYTNRRNEIRDRFKQIEKQAAKLKIKADDDSAWKLHALANEYRSLLLEAWNMPVVREPRPTLEEGLS